MGELHATDASLRFFGDDLDPVELTASLGREPTVGVRKGGVWKTSRGAEKVARTGSRRLSVARRQPGNLDEQCDEILAALTDVLSIWRNLTNRFQAELLWGLCMREGNEGVELSPDTLKDLGERGLSLDLDIYGPEISD